MKNDEWYTPQADYDRILSYVNDLFPETVGAKIVRPFYPGGDYQSVDYTDAIVVDNPPFSILSKIIRWYQEHDVKFVLFCPGLTGTVKNVGYVFFPDNRIKYSRGPIVTCLVTNLTDYTIIYGGGDGEQYELNEPIFTSANATVAARHFRERHVYRVTRCSGSIKNGLFGTSHKIEEVIE